MCVCLSVGTLTAKPFDLHNEFVCVSQSITKKRTFGQKDCTIWETREVGERSGVFIYD